MRPWRLLRTCARKLVALILIAALLALLCLCVRGLPAPFQSYLMERINSGPFVWQIDRLRLCPLGGLVASRARVFRKGFIGAPLFEAPEVVLDVSPFAWVNKEPLVEGCTIRRGIFRRDTTGRRDPGRADVYAQLWFRLEDCSLEGIPIARCVGIYTLDGQSARIEDVHGSLTKDVGGGEFSGDFRFNRVTRAYDYDIQRSTVDPHVLLPMLRDRGMNALAELISSFAFGRTPPRIDMHLAGIAGPPANLTVEATVEIEGGTYRLSAFDRMTCSVDGRLNESERILRLSPLSVEHDGRSCWVDCTLDLIAYTTEFNVVSGVDPHRVAPMLGKKVVAALSNLRFGDQCQILARGIVGHTNPALTSIEAKVEGNGLGVGSVVTDACSLEWTQSGFSNHFSEIEGTLWGGDLDADIVLVRDPATEVGTCLLTGSADGMAFRDFAANVMRKSGEQYLGSISLSGWIRARTSPDWLNDADGEIEVKLEHTQLFRIPLFGGLTDLLTKVFRPLDKMLEQTKATATVTIGGGRMTTQNLKIDGKLLRVKGKGYYNFRDNSVDFELRVTIRDKTIAEKIIELPIKLLNELFFEIRLTGTTEKPKWYLRRFSKDILQTIGLGGD